MNSKNLFYMRLLWLTFISLAILKFGVVSPYAQTFSLVKSIDLTPLVGDDGSIEVDVVGDELYVANWRQDKYYRIDPVSSNVLGSFSLDGGILIDNHGSEYNPATGTILHARDDDAGGYPGFDAFFETDINGNVLNGPYDLFGPGDNSEDPESLTVDPNTGRIWVSAVSQPGGITEIDPNDSSILNQINIGGAAWALGFNPNSGNLFFADIYGVIWEIAPDGTGLSMVFDPGVGEIYGMAFTPTGDLVLLEFAAEGFGIPPPSRLLLYDSSDDADNVFTTSGPPQIPEDSDGDGLPDDEDACPFSDLSDTVIIDNWDTGVGNVLLVDGCTISDLIAECAEAADNHGEFVSSVSHTTNSLKKKGIITGKEKENDSEMCCKG